MSCYKVIHYLLVKMFFFGVVFHLFYYVLCNKSIQFLLQIPVQTTLALCLWMGTTYHRASSVQPTHTHNTAQIQTLVKVARTTLSLMVWVPTVTQTAWVSSMNILWYLKWKKFCLWSVHGLSLVKKSFGWISID